MQTLQTSRPVCDDLLTRLPLAGADIATVRAKLPVHSYEAFGQLGRVVVAYTS